ncbi:hypothetical protein KBB68_03135 [Candidatus Babeliales bacterium]|nr:hypothetical protein [Candidatus Babeliales bacterium]
MNKKIYFLLSFCIFYNVLPMNKTTPKLSKLSWLQRLKTYWQKSSTIQSPNTSLPKEPIKNKFNQFAEEQVTNQKILNLLNTLTADEQKKIQTAFTRYQSNWSNFQQQQNKNQIIEEITREQKLLLQSMIFIKNHHEILHNHEKFINWYNQLPWKEVKLIAKAMNSYLKLFDVYIESFQNNVFSPMGETLKVIQKNIRSLYENLNLSSPENLALQHFQDTQAPSDLYIPIDAENNYLGWEIASYKPAFSHIKIGKEFRNMPPACQYNTILHEYRHHLQSLNNAIETNKTRTKEQEKFYSKEILQKAKAHIDNPSWLIYEHDADHFSIEHITCPTCLKIIKSNKYNIKSSNGYFNDEDIEPFIKEAVNNPSCPAHTKTPQDDQHNFIVQQLEEKLTMLHSYPMTLSESKKLKLKDHENHLKNLIKEIEDLDKQSGNLLQHIPSYNRDFIRKIAEQKEFQELLGAKLLKELDVRQTMEKVEKLSQKEEFPLLEEHKIQPLIVL